MENDKSPQEPQEAAPGKSPPPTEEGRTVVVKKHRYRAGPFRRAWNGILNVVQGSWIDTGVDFDNAARRPADEPSPRGDTRDSADKDPLEASPQAPPKFLRGIAGAFQANWLEASAALREVRNKIRDAVTAQRLRYSGPSSPLPSIKALRGEDAGWALPHSLSSPSSKFLGPIQGKRQPGKFRDVLIVGDMEFLGAALLRAFNLAGCQDITVAAPFSESLAIQLPLLDFREYLGSEERESLTGRASKDARQFSHVFYLGGWTIRDMPFAKALLARTIKNGGRFIAISRAPSPQRQRASDGTVGLATSAQMEAEAMARFFDRFATAESPDKTFLSLKYHWLFGPGETSEDGVNGLVSRAFREIQETGAVRLPEALAPKTGKVVRKFDFISVLEAARLAVSLAQNPATEGVYELGSGEAHPVMDLAKAVFSALRKKSRIEWDATLTLPPGPSQAADVSRAKEIGWDPGRTSLKQAVADFVETHLKTGFLLGEEPQQPKEPQQPPQVEKPLSPPAATALPEKKADPFMLP